MKTRSAVVFATEHGARCQRETIERFGMCVVLNKKVRRAGRKAVPDGGARSAPPPVREGPWVGAREWRGL